MANRSLEQSIYLRRSCLPLVVVDLGEKDVAAAGSPGANARGCAGSKPSGRVQLATWRIIASSLVKSIGLVMWAVNPASRLRRMSSSMP